MEPATIGLIIGSVGGTIGIVGTLTTWLKGGFRHSFDSEKAQQDIIQLKKDLKDLEVQQEEDIKLLNMQIISKVSEAKSHYESTVSGLRTDLTTMNRHIMEMTEKLGKLAGLIEGQNRRN